MTTGASGSSSDTSPSKKKGWPKGRKRKLLPKDVNAPKGPLSGYMLFMSEQRELMRQKNSGVAFPEVTKMVAQKWAQLDVLEKQKYLEAADADKERYQKELEEYQKTESYKKFVQKQITGDSPQAKKARKDMLMEGKSQDSLNADSTLEIPIFTEEFLNHNKLRETELRQLRRSNTEYEEQNAILQKHIENMRSAVQKLENENQQQKSNNAALQQHITTLRKTLTKAFTNVPIPGNNESPKEDTIDSYMMHLHSLITSSPQQHQKLIQNVKSIINQLSLT